MLGKNKSQQRDASKDLGKPFDLTVHKGDRNQHVNGYQLTIVNGQHVYERPVGSGHYYSANGEYLTEADLEVMEQAGQAQAKPKSLKEQLAMAKTQDTEAQPEKPKASDDHYDKPRAQQEIDEQGAKATQGTPPGKKA